MLNKRTIKISIVVSIVVGVAVLSLALLTGTSEAQGPGGRGQGDGTGNTGSGYRGDRDQYATNGYGAGTMNQYQTQAMLDPANLPPAVDGELSDDVIAAIVAGLQDEYNAYDTYQAVIDQFGAVRPFTSIQAAEATHIEALEFIFDRYDIELPDRTGVDVPVFDSLADACAVAADAEIANFSLYDEWLATVQDYPDIVQVFTALRDASEFNHLPAFERCAAR